MFLADNTVISARGLGRTIIVVGCVGLVIGTYGLRARALRLQVPTEITYPQVYAGPDGETHFREVKVPITSEITAPPAQPIAQSAARAATTIRHAVFPAGWGVYDRDHGVFHNASSARFITVRRGVVWIKASDGETRRFQPGDIVEVLDVVPSKGHITWVGDEPLVALFSNHP